MGRQYTIHTAELPVQVAVPPILNGGAPTRPALPRKAARAARRRKRMQRKRRHGWA